MKKEKLFGYFIAITVLIASCKKKEQEAFSTSNTPSLTVCLLTKEVTNNPGSQKDSVLYFYNSQNQVVKRIRSFNGNKDTVMYNNLGQIFTMKSYSHNNGQISDSSIYRYTYTGNNITQIIWYGYDVNPEQIDTFSFSYNGSQLTQMITRGDPYGNLELKNIIWSNGNISAYTMDYHDGSKAVSYSRTYDNYKNTYRFFPPIGFDIIYWANANNITSVKNGTTGNTTNYQYSYTNQGELLSAGTGSYSETYTYDCQ